MATANLLDTGWSINKTNSSIEFTTSSTAGIKFRMPSSASNKTGWAKGCISFNASKYSKIVIKYSKISTVGNTDLYCGVYNSISASSNDPATSSLVTSSFNKTNGGTITFNIPSSVSGTKYVGFYFYGNSNDADNGSSEHIYVTSIVATERTYTLTYNANGGSGAPGAVSGVISTTISSTVPTRTGYNFLGWSTSSTATSASYSAGDSITLNSDVKLYAVWKGKTYTVTYNANGGSNAPSSQTKTHGVDLILTEDTPTPPSRKTVTYTISLNPNGGTCDKSFIEVTDYTNYYFESWNTNIDGTGDTYYYNGKYTKNNKVTLYAQYSFDFYDREATLPTPIRKNYDFLGWATDPYATSGITGRYNPTNNVTLYAIWKCKGNAYIRDSNGEFSQYEILIYDGSGWNQYAPYIYTESGWTEYFG